MEIAVYCSWQNTVSRDVRLATSVGVALGERGHNLVYGGGDVGPDGQLSPMGAVAIAASVAGSAVTAVTRPEWTQPIDRTWDSLIEVPSMHERKIRMEDLADAFLVLPGGLGTAEELLSLLAGIGNADHAKPVVLVDPWGFYDGLVAWLATAAHAGYLSPATLAHTRVCRDASAAVEAAERVTAVR